MTTFPPFPQWSQGLLTRFCSYVQVYTTSDPLSTTKPSSQNQWDLIHLLARELQAMGVESVQVLDQGYLLARIPGSPGTEEAPTIALVAHVDTAPDAPGQGVRPRVHSPYLGGDVVLEAGAVLRESENPELTACRGKTLITSDGTTLLGADDKAGVAEIVTAVELWLKHPEIPHPPLEIVFTTDEEVGRGTEGFPLELMNAQAAYTLDGDRQGTYQRECYYASAAHILFTGISHHPGDARGKLVNALSMASSFIQMLPRSESPEATDGRFGCLWPNRLEGEVESAKLTVPIRDFDEAQLQRREALVRTLAGAVEAIYPGGRVQVEIHRQYDNMRAGLEAHPKVTELLTQAISQAGMTPQEVPIRGGTDGARLTSLGLPTPNIFTGGMNYHSRTEWACLEVMGQAVETLLHLGALWAREVKS